MLRLIKKSKFGKNGHLRENKKKSSRDHMINDCDLPPTALNELNEILKTHEPMECDQNLTKQSTENEEEIVLPTPNLYAGLLDSVKYDNHKELFSSFSNQSIDFQKRLFPHLLYEGSFIKTTSESQSNYTNRSKPLLEEVRVKLRQAFEDNPDLYYQRDMDLALNDEWYLKRYLIARNRNVNNTVHMVLGSFALRKQLGFRDHGWDYFPNETHSIGAMFTYAPDREGYTTLYMRIRVVNKDDVIQKLIKLYSGKYLCELEEIAQTRLTIIVDFSGTGWANADLDLLFFALNYLTRYLPSIVRRILLVDMPWILRKTFKVIQQFIPEELITHEELIRDVIDPANAPDFVGGHCQLPYRGFERSHPNSTSLIDFGFNHFPQYTLKKTLDYTKVYLPLITTTGQLSAYHTKLSRMLELAIKEFGIKTTCGDVLERFPELLNMKADERLDFLCQVMNEYESQEIEKALPSASNASQMGPLVVA